MTPDVNVFIIDFKDVNRHEVVSLNEDDSYSIFINARLSKEAQIKAYEHAMRHIMSDDFSKSDIQEIETAAHEMVNRTAISSEAQKPAISTSTHHRPKHKKRRRNRKQERYVQERAAFLRENFDMFSLAEHNYLYGKDL